MGGRLIWIVSVALAGLAAPSAASAGQPAPEPQELDPEAALPPPLLAPGRAADAVPTPRGAGGPTQEEQVLELVNQERWLDGQKPPLKGNPLADAAAETHSVNMQVRNFFGHCDLDTGTWPSDRLVAQGFFPNSSGENIAAGYATPEIVMAAWMASGGHRANILSTSYREIGVGHYFENNDQANIRNDLNIDCIAESFNNGPYKRYWTQSFARRNDVYPVVIDREAYSTNKRQVQLYLYGGNWADEMRIRNQGGAFGAWTPFAADVAWELSAGDGEKTVEVEIRNGAVVRSASDSILLDDPLFYSGFESGGSTAWSATTP